MVFLCMDIIRTLSTPPDWSGNRVLEEIVDEVISAVGGVIGSIDGWLWSWPLIIILVGTHLYMTIRTKFIQRKIGKAIKLSVTADPDAEGNISQFGALTTTLSATIGTGNIVGVATAIVSGGPGAVFWMWIIGVLGIATKYAETFIALKYRVKDKNGDMLGGAMFALERGFPGKSWAKIIAILFAVFAALASFGIGAAVQSNSVCGIIEQYIPAVPIWAIGVVVAVLVGLVIFGGIKSISKVCEKIVPFMAIFYVVCCFFIICMNGAYVGDAFKWIVVCAFSPQAMVGGGLGFAVLQAIRYGAARGLFSNESGMGSAPLAAANAATKNPARQGLVIMSGAFWDTVIICLMTALTLITTILASPELSAAFQITNAAAVGETVPSAVSSLVAGTSLADGFSKGLVLTTTAFNQIPIFGPLVLVVGMVLFAFTTMLGWSWYGDRVITYLFGEKAKNPYRIIFLIFIILGAVGGSAALASTVWDFADIMNGLMVIPNVIAIWALAKVIVKDTNHYVYDDNIDEMDTTEIPVWERGKKE